MFVRRQLRQLQNTHKTNHTTDNNDDDGESTRVVPVPDTMETRTDLDTYTNYDLLSPSLNRPSKASRYVEKWRSGEVAKWRSGECVGHVHNSTS